MVQEPTAVDVYSCLRANWICIYLSSYGGSGHTNIIFCCTFIDRADGEAWPSLSWEHWEKTKNLWATSAAGMPIRTWSYRLRLYEVYSWWVWKLTLNSLNVLLLRNVSRSCSSRTRCWSKLTRSRPISWWETYLLEWNTIKYNFSRVSAETDPGAMQAAGRWAANLKCLLKSTEEKLINQKEKDSLTSSSWRRNTARCHWFIMQYKELYFYVI